MKGFRGGNDYESIVRKLEFLQTLGGGCETKKFLMEHLKNMFLAFDINSNKN